jgi:hypothetical protein
MDPLVYPIAQADIKPVIHHNFVYTRQTVLRPLLFPLLSFKFSVAAGPGAKQKGYGREVARTLPVVTTDIRVRLARDPIAHHERGQWPKQITHIKLYFACACPIGDPRAETAYVATWEEWPFCFVIWFSRSWGYLPLSTNTCP